MSDKHLIDTSIVQKLDSTPCAYLILLNIRTREAEQFTMSRQRPARTLTTPIIHTYQYLQPRSIVQSLSAAILNVHPVSPEYRGRTECSHVRFPIDCPPLPLNPAGNSLRLPPNYPSPLIPNCGPCTSFIRSSLS